MTLKKEDTHTNQVSDLVGDPVNRRRHTPRNIDMIVDSLQKVGTGRSIVIDETNTVLAGNATLLAAIEAGITDLKIVDVDGSELVAVRRTGLSETKKLELALYDNRTAELAEWDASKLLEDVNNNVDLSAFFYDEELQSILDRTEDVDLDQFFQPDQDANKEAMMSLVLKFSPDKHRDVLKALESHGKSPEQALLQLLDLK